MLSFWNANEEENWVKLSWQQSWDLTMLQEAEMFDCVAKRGFPGCFCDFRNGQHIRKYVVRQLKRWSFRGARLAFRLFPSEAIISPLN